MAGKSIYPSIPSPGNDMPSMRATLDAIRQTLTMITINAQVPSANYTPSSAAQIFVTKAELSQLGLLNSSGGSTKSNAVTQQEFDSLKARLQELETRVRKNDDD